MFLIEFTLKLNLWVQQRLSPILPEYRGQGLGGCFLAGRSVLWLLCANEYHCWWTRLFLKDTHWKMWVMDHQNAVGQFIRPMFWGRKDVHTMSEYHKRRTQGHESPPTHKCHLDVCVFQSSTCNIVPVCSSVCVIFHVPSKNNLYITFLSLTFWVIAGQRLRILNVVVTE